MEVLSCGFNQLTNLDVTKNTALTYLDCESMPTLKCIKVTNVATALSQRSWYKEAKATYSLDCSGITSTTDFAQNNTTQVYLEILGWRLLV